MAERTAFDYNYGLSQGRLAPSLYKTTDGRYAYVLGSEYTSVMDFGLDDYVEISQTFDMTGKDLVRFDGKIVQPETPEPRVLPASCTLKLTEVIPRLDKRSLTYATAVHPGVETRLKERFSIVVGAVLRISIDGGVDQDITFSSVDTLSAQQVVTIINATLTGGLAQVGPDPLDRTVVITSNSTGRLASIEVVSHALPAGDANDSLQFNQRSPAAPIYGGDDLSALLAPSGTFSQSDTLALIALSGCTNPSNDGTNQIMAVYNDQLAILRYAVVTEAAGFTAKVVGGLWTAKALVDDTAELSFAIDRSRTLTSNDFAINVSKLSGNHKLALRWQLVADAL